MSYRTVTRLVTLKFLTLFNSSLKKPPEEEKFLSDHVPASNEKQFCPSKETNFESAIKNSERQISNLLLERGIPGMTICVAKQGKIVWHQAFGFCDVENQLPCRPEARMRIASISKPLFVAPIVGPLIERKQIDLDASIHRYLSEEEFPRQKFNDKKVDITIKQLISHTSGISHYDEGNHEKPLRPIGSPGSKKVHQCPDQYNRTGFFQRETFRSTTEALKPFKEGPLVSEPGSKFQYTTYGYTLLSAVMEKIYSKLDKEEKNAAKKDCDKQIEDRWMEILRRDWKMRETSLDQDEPILPNRSRYYLRTAENGCLINAPYSDNSVKWAGGGIVSTTQDLAIFGLALIDAYKGRPNARLNSDTVNLLWKEVKNSFGLGFERIDRDTDKNDSEKVAIYHSGGALGASSAFLIYPESEIVVVILINLGGINMRSLALFVAEQFKKNQ